MAFPNGRPAEALCIGGFAEAPRKPLDDDWVETLQGHGRFREVVGEQ
jgi:hypothetical protein